MNVKNKFTIDKVLKLSLLCFSCVTIIGLITSFDMPNNQLIKKQSHLAVRTIGDRLLTYAQEFDVPVPPLQKIDEHTLRLSFKNPISINPDSLSLLVIKYLDSEITTNAIINVLEAKSGKIVYGFEINHLEPKEIPCLGRILPASRYYVDISFYEVKHELLGLNAFTFGLIGFTFVSCTLIGISFFRSKEQTPTNNTTIQVKGIKLDLNTNQILSKDKKIKLTNKEAEIFNILFKNEGKLVSREYLTEEIWLKQGVVTGRSLDMYISRLRKKVKELSNVEILNQHGKGYILKI